MTGGAAGAGLDTGRPQAYMRGCMRVLRAVVLTIALAMAAASAGAQGVLEQLRARSVPEPPCRRFETALEMRNAGDWNVLDVVPHDMSARAKIVEEDLQMRGGIRLVLEVDTA